MAVGGDEGALAVRMGEPDRKVVLRRCHRPAVGDRAEFRAQKSAELVIAEIGGDLKGDAERLPGESDIAGRAAGPHFVVRDDDFGARLRPGRDRPDDQVDIDVADDGERAHGRYSVRVIFVLRRGVPTSATRAAAKSSMKRCAAGSMAKIAASPAARGSAR